MSALLIAFGTVGLLVLGVRVGWSFGYRDGVEDGRRDRRGLRGAPAQDPQGSAL